MADSTKNFVTIFSILDRFSAGYAKIEKQIATLQDRIITIPIKLDSGAVARIDSVNKKLENSFGGTAQAATSASKATTANAKAQKEGADAAEKSDASHKKQTSTLGALRDQYDKVSGSVGNFKEKIAGLAALVAGGTIAGFSWAASQTTSLYQEQMFRQLESLRGSKAQNMDAVRASVEEASASAWTESSDRLSNINLLAGRGGKKRAVPAAENIEKIFFANQEFLQKEGVAGSSQDLASFATSPQIRSKAQKEMLSRFFEQYGVKNFGSKSQSQRLRILGQLDLDSKINIDTEQARRPLSVIQQRLESIGKAVGKELAPTMNWLANKLAAFLTIIDKNPMAPKVIAIGAAVLFVAGGLVTLITLLPTVVAGFTAFKAGIVILQGLAKAQWLATLATGGLSGAMSILAAVEAFVFSPAFAILAVFTLLAGVIGYLAYRSGALSTIWKDLGKIWKDISTGKFDKILPDVTKMLSKIDLGAVFKFSGFGAIEYVLNYISRRLDDLFGITDVAGKATTYLLKTVTDILTWLWNTIKGLYSWLMHIIPGGDKAVAKGAWEKEMKKAGVEYKDGKYYSTKEQASVGTWDNALQKYKTYESGLGKEVTPPQSVLDAQVRFESEKGFVDTIFDKLSAAIPGAEKEAKRKEMEKMMADEGLYRTKERWGETLPSGAKPTPDSQLFQTGTPSDKLSKLYEDWKNLPGFADGIAQAVASGLGGIGDTIANKIKDVFPDYEFPDFAAIFKPLTDALGVLSLKLEEWGLISGNSSTTLGGTSLAAGAPTSSPIGRNQPKAPDDIGDYAYTAGFATGATFTKGGLFRGKVHSPEEIIPQATAQRGPGAIARALNALEAKAIGVGSTNEIHVHNNNDYDFSGMKVSSDIDIESLLRRVNKSVEATTLETVKRALGQGRT
jgi:hypothetical protein